MKKPTAIVAVIGLLAAVVAAWYLQRTAGPGPTSLSMGRDAAADKAGGPAAAGRDAAGAPKGPGGPGGGGGPGGPSGPGGPVAVEVGKAVAMRLEDDAQAVGSLKARRSVVLRPEVSGRVSALGFVDGARVRKGQLLLQLDDTLPQAQLKQAEAQAAIARTNLTRSRELAAQNFVSQSAVDQNAAALDVAQAQVALAQAQVLRMRVVAPFDAVAGIRVVNVGDYLKDGADVVTLDDIGAVFLDFKLPERYVPQVKVGKTVQATVDAMAGQTFQGVVTALDSQVDANGRALLVRAELSNPQGNLRPGMFARARVVFSVRERAVVVPEEALVPLAGKQYLFKVANGPKGAVSQRVEAKLGMRVPGRVEILEGVAAGDAVVTAGHARLVRGDGVPLRVIDLDKPGGARGVAGAASGAAPGAAARAASGGVLPGAASGAAPMRPAP